MGNESEKQSTKNLELVGEGLTMDTSGNTLITDHRHPSELLVYSSCGELIKSI